MKRGLKVLIIPLDWGLGHATRCIPMIQHMLSLGWNVTLAGEGKISDLLSTEFPDLPMLTIKGYRIRYPKKGWLFIPTIIFQIPKIISSIIYEHHWLKKQWKKYEWDVVISDNRYGLYTKRAKTIIITHQLHLISGIGHSVDMLLQRLVYTYIHRYNTCWVPDTADQLNIAGLLSHPSHLPDNVQFIGPISRLEKRVVTEENFILLLLSGPEPQRTLLEAKLIEQATCINETFICIRGLPEQYKSERVAKNIRFVNHAPAQTLSHYIQQSKMVICRTGYSTVMDLIKLNKKALMIPTPGQTEQEYLGKRLTDLNWFVVQAQQYLDLPIGIEACLSNTKKIPALKFDMYSKALEEFSIQYFGV